MRAGLRFRVVLLVPVLVLAGCSGRTGASQTATAARRDGVLPELARLPFDCRVKVSRWVSAPEGTWALSSPPTEARCGGPSNLGDPRGLYGRDWVNRFDYGEVLLLDHSARRIIRAYPLPGLPPQQLVLSAKAVYCARQGDGSLPDSMLCRIDRTTKRWTARLYPSTYDSPYGDPAMHRYAVPDNWTSDSLVRGPVIGLIRQLPDGSLVTEQNGHRFGIDPVTLELLGDVPRATATACTSAAMIDAVRAALPLPPPDRIDHVDVDRCANTFARVSAVPTTSGCHPGGQCYQIEQVFLQEQDGVWQVIASGTGINCADPADTGPRPQLAAACDALGLR